MSLAEIAVAAERPQVRQDGLAGETGRTDAPGFAEAARRCLQVAREIGAADFGLYSVTPPSERATLVPLFDSGCTAALASDRGRGHPVVAHARASTAPCWWSDDAASASSRAFARLGWARNMPPLIAGAAGIAFPVQAERGECGLVVFLGDAMTLSPEDLPGVHARCFALFEDASRLRQGAGLPPISRRELECLKLAANGHTAEEIARLLKLSVHTANQYLTGTTQKLGAVNRMHAVAKALRMGLIA